MKKLKALVTYSTDDGKILKREPIVVRVCWNESPRVVEIALPDPPGGGREQSIYIRTKTLIDIIRREPRTDFGFGAVRRAVATATKRASKKRRAR